MLELWSHLACISFSLSLRLVQEADSLASVPLGAAHPTAPASAKRTKAAAAAGVQGGASRKEKKGKHKGWLAVTALSLGCPAPTMGLAGVLSSRLGGEGLGERPRGEPRLALRNPQLAHRPPPTHMGPGWPVGMGRTLLLPQDVKSSSAVAQEATPRPLEHPSP